MVIHGRFYMLEVRRKQKRRSVRCLLCTQKKYKVLVSGAKNNRLKGRRAVLLVLKSTFYSFFFSLLYKILCNIALQPNKKFLRKKRRKPLLHQLRPSPHFTDCFKCDLLSSLSQFVTLPFQSQVCLSMSNANPLGQVICFRPDLVHLAVKQKGALI